MAKHAARLCLLALLVFAAAVHVTADDLSDALDAVKGLHEKVKGVKPSLGGARGDKGSRSDVTACYRGNTLTCAYTARCSSSDCDCCGCPCATLTCWVNTIKTTYNTAARAAPLVKTPAQRRAVRKTFCDLARVNGSFTRSVVNLYREIKCPGYLSIIRSLNGYQANYNKWCKAFSA